MRNGFIYTRLVLTVAAAFALGTLVGGKVVLDDPTTGLGRVINQTLGQPADVDFSLYWDVYNRILEQFPGQVDEQTLLHGAARGTIAALDDPYSLFLSPEEAERFFQDLDGEFSGIGAEITQEGEEFLIVAPLPGSPAEAAGLRAKDVITSVDGKAATEFVFGELISAIRGAGGTTVTLGIRRGPVPGIGTGRGQQELTVPVTRGTIEVSSVTSQIRDDKIGVITLSQFAEDTTRKAVAAADEFLAAGVTGIILDLRNNPGGLLDGSVEIASLFIPEGTVVIEVDKDSQQKEFATTLEDKLAEVPTIVLINKGSASGGDGGRRRLLRQRLGPASRHAPGRFSAAPDDRQVAHPRRPGNRRGRDHAG